MPYADLGRTRGLQFRPLSKIAFFIFVANFLVLMVLGAKHVESPYIEYGQISTIIYFAHFLIIVPLVSIFENSLIELSNSINNNTKNIIQSVCSHTTAAVCGICSAAAAAHTAAVGNCMHIWTLVYHSTMKPHHVGAFCDFNNGDHIAITSVQSVAKTCELCHALCCAGCFGF